MRILLLTQWFDPEPTFKGLLFAKELQKEGHEVEVITGFPNYPGGKVYPGYKISLRKKENIDGIKITRVALYPSHDNSGIKRIINYISFAFMATMYGVFRQKKVDVMYVYHPPLTVGIAGKIISFFRRIPYVYDIQDLWPETLKATGMISNASALKLVEKVSNLTYKSATKLVVLSPGFKKMLVKRGVSEKKISVIYNWCDEQVLNIETEYPYEVDFPTGFNVVFAGNIGPAQALSSVIYAAEMLQKDEQNINFIFVGSGLSLEGIKKLTADKNLNNVYFFSRLPMNKIGSILKKADALLVHLKDDPLFSITIPSKTQAYMSVGKPILMAVKGDAANLITESKAGLVCKPENPESIAEAAVKLATMNKQDLGVMGVAGKHFYNEVNLSSGTEKFIKLFEEMT